MEITEEMVLLASQLPDAVDAFKLLPTDVAQFLIDADGDPAGFAEFMAYHRIVRKSAITRVLKERERAGQPGRNHRPIDTPPPSLPAPAVSQPPPLNAAALEGPATQGVFYFEGGQPPVAASPVVNTRRDPAPAPVLTAVQGSRRSLLGMEAGTRDLQLGLALEQELIVKLPYLPSFPRNKSGQRQSYSHMLFLFIVRYGIETTKGDVILTRKRINESLNRYLDVVCGPHCDQAERDAVRQSAQNSVRYGAQGVTMFRESPKAYAAQCAAQLSREFMQIAPLHPNSEIVRWLVSASPQTATALYAHVDPPPR
jgi:hypothetical protein